MHSNTTLSIMPAMVAMGLSPGRRVRQTVSLPELLIHCVITEKPMLSLQVFSLVNIDSPTSEEPNMGTMSRYLHMRCDFGVFTIL